MSWAAVILSLAEAALLFAIGISESCRAHGFNFCLRPCIPKVAQSTHIGRLALLNRAPKTSILPMKTNLAQMTLIIRFVEFPEAVIKSELTRLPLQAP